VANADVSVIRWNILPSGFVDDLDLIDTVSITVRVNSTAVVATAKT